MDKKEFDELMHDIEKTLDMRYKLKDDCDKEMDAVNDKLAQGSKEFAVINTKLSAILWLLGTLGVAVIGFLVKYVFGG